MSGLAGVFWRSGRPAHGTCLDPLLAPMAHRGRAVRWTGPHVALAELSPCPASPSTREPTWGVAFAGRIDNREDLVRTLDVTRACPDRDLVLAAYRRWADAFPEHLYGDFAVALWDPGKRALVCARDPFGLRPFYYHLGRDVFVFASDLSAVLAHASVSRRIDEGMAGEVLSVNIASTTASLFADVKRLAPGHVAVITPTRARERAWWRPPSAPVDVRRPRDWAGALGHALREAVACRMKGAQSVGMHLSGGYDSSTITAFARSLVRSDQGVEAFANVYPGRSCDESSFVRDVARHVGVRVHEIPEPTFTAESFLRSIERSKDLPDYPAEVSSRALRKAATERGISVMLTGYGGDEGNHSTSVQVLEHLMRGQLHRVRASVAGVRTRHGEAAARRVVRRTVAASLPHALRRALGRARSDSGTAPWIRPEWARAVHLDERMQPQPAGLRSPAKAEMARAYAAGWNVHGHEMEERAASHQGLDQRHPFLDRRVVELALSAPEHVRIKPGDERSLLRQAVGDALPASVCNRQTKAAFDHVFVEALRCLDAYDDWPSLCVAKAGWVDEDVLRRMHQAFRDTNESTGSPGPQGFALWSVLSLEHWARAVASL